MGGVPPSLAPWGEPVPPPSALDPALGAALAQGWLPSAYCRDTPSHRTAYQSCHLPTEVLSYLLGIICSLDPGSPSMLTPGFCHLACDSAPLTFSSSMLACPHFPLGLMSLPSPACPHASPAPFRDLGIAEEVAQRNSNGDSSTGWRQLNWMGAYGAAG